MTELLTAPTPATTPRRARGAGPVSMVLGGAISVQSGAAVAALLFPRAGVAGVVTLRLVIAAAVLVAVARPRLRGHRRSDWLAVGAFGVALAGMNVLIYQAIERIPLGVAVTVEVLGPLVRFPQADGLALSMTVAAALTLPWGLMSAGFAMLDPVTLGLGAAVALLSSVLPYTLELLALRRLPTSTFAVLMSLGPAFAALAGFLVLDQALSVVQLLAITLVVAASAGAVRAAGSRSGSGPTPG